MTPGLVKELWERSRRPLLAVAGLPAGAAALCQCDQAALNARRARLTLEFHAIDRGYLEFLAQQAKMATGEKAAGVQRCIEALKPFLDERLLRLQLADSGHVLTARLHPETFAVIHWEYR